MLAPVSRRSERVRPAGYVRACEADYFARRRSVDTLIPTPSQVGLVPGQKQISWRAWSAAGRTRVSWPVTSWRLVSMVG